MKNISTKIVSSLIQNAIRNGKSEQIQVENSDMPYFRMLVSRYNSANGTKISVRGVHGVYRQVCAPHDRFIDDVRWKSSFDMVQQVLNDSRFMLNKDQLAMIEKKLHSIVDLCRKQTINNGNLPDDQLPGLNDLLG